MYAEVPGHPNYRVSTLGTILNKNGEYVGSGVRQIVLFGPRHARKLHTVADLMLRTFVRAPRKGEMALHRDDDPSHNVLPNLYWGTRRQNYRDAIKNGKMRRKS